MKPQEVVVVCRKGSEKGKRPGSVIVVRLENFRGSDSRGLYTWGANMAGWRDLSDEQIYQALTWLAFEMVEFYGVPVRQVRDCLEDWVDGYRDWSRKCAAPVCAIGIKR